MWTKSPIQRNSLSSVKIMSKLKVMISMIVERTGGLAWVLRSVESVTSKAVEERRRKEPGSVSCNHRADHYAFAWSEYETSDKEIRTFFSCGECFLKDYNGVSWLRWEFIKGAIRRQDHLSSPKKDENA